MAQSAPDGDVNKAAVNVENLCFNFLKCDFRHIFLCF